MSVAEPFVAVLERLRRSSERLIEDFKLTRYEKPDFPIKEPQFTEYCVFGARLFSFLLEKVDVCSFNLIAHDVLYPEFSEEFGNSILLTIDDMGVKFLKYMKRDVEVISNRFGKFANYALETCSKQFSITGAQDPIYFLQQTTVWIFLMSLSCSRNSVSFLSFGPNCWAKVFSKLYIKHFNSEERWAELKNQSIAVAKSHLPQNMREQDMNEVLQRVKLLLKNFRCPPEIADSVAQSESVSLYSMSPISMNSLWNENGSDYINIHIFASELFNHFFKMCGFVADSDQRLIVGNSQKSLLEGIESIAKATLLMLLFQTSDEEYLTQKFRLCLQNFVYNSDFHEDYWLYAQKCGGYFIRTSYFCLKALQMTGWIFEMVLKSSNRCFLNTAYKIWTQVFILKYGREYSRRGGWELFIRDALPVIKEHTSEEILQMVENDKWSDVVQLYRSLDEGEYFISESDDSAEIQMDQASEEIEAVPSTSRIGNEAAQRSPDTSSYHSALGGKGAAYVKLVKLTDSESVYQGTGAHERSPKRRSTEYREGSSAEANIGYASTSSQGIAGLSSPKKSRVEAEPLSKKSPELSKPECSPVKKVAEKTLRFFVSPKELRPDPKPSRKLSDPQLQSGSDKYERVKGPTSETAEKESNARTRNEESPGPSTQTEIPSSDNSEIKKEIDDSQVKQAQKSVKDLNLRRTPRKTPRKK